MQINLVTSNKNKVKELKAYLEPGIKVNHIGKEYKELRSYDSEEIAKESAQRLANELKKPVVAEDSGLFIKGLNGFPGTCSKYVHQRIGLKGILKLMEDIDDREAFYRSAIAYCEPKKEPISFLGEEKGAISEEIKGSYGFGHDPIFIPENSKKTYGETEKCENLKRFRRKAAEKLRYYLLEERQ